MKKNKMTEADRFSLLQAIITDPTLNKESLVENLENGFLHKLIPVIHDCMVVNNLDDYRDSGVWKEYLKSLEAS